MKIISWNVNGIRAVLKKGFMEFLGSEKPDIICIQETKAHPDQVDMILLEYPHHFWNSADRKGYSGTAIFSRIKPLHVHYDLGIEEHDTEGRIITLEFEEFYLTTVYTPNAGRDLSRLNYRHKEWDPAFLDYIRTLEKEKPVIFCGDLNVAHKEIDLKNPQTNKTTKSRPGNAGFTDQERKGFDNIINAGFIDSFRHFHPDKEQYTWWSYMFNARAKNIGWRIDYFCISHTLTDRIGDAFILDQVTGSDHCPVGIIYKE